ncbi:MAG: penicillin acylase family protein [Euryhalocaulis sp.]|uniref:penicillin acylase family protein n=1 Tax=Euryhalocaulis sp. TaxID=2744307 RepID=UPI0017BFA134|nr:penicillin acylase family protein [Euryhalocaulis sp.]MBA4801269.1 penicillin acylase family protein [Euryhalocaulis sp.]
MKLVLWAFAAGLMLSGGAAAQTYGETSRIVRDEWGVPFVYGETDADAAFALAYAEAEDDFSTLQDVLLMTRAEMGTVHGREGAQIDFMAHFLNVREKAARGYASEISDETRALVDGYAAGLNAYAEAHPDEVIRRGLFPATGEDIVAGFILRSPFFFGLDRAVGPIFDGEKPARFEPLEAGGSNGFAIAPSRSADGATRLIANSHQPWEGPVAWYEARMASGQGMCFAGALFPGSPVILLGHNRNLGWTNTVNRPDLVDIYELELDRSGKRYRYDGEWRDLERERVWLRVKFGPVAVPIPKTIKRSIHGPVIENDHGAYAVRYATQDETRHVQQYYELTKAGDWAEWLDVMRMQAIPATNFIYADRDGNIAMLYNAQFPDRAEGYDWRDVLPGEEAAALWDGPVDFAQIPLLANPASGYVVNSNNTPFVATSEADNLDRADYPERLGIEKRMTNRIMRAVKLLDADDSITRAELETIKYDRGYEPDSPEGLEFQKVIAAGENAADLKAATETLKNWDWSLDGEGMSDALAVLIMGPLMVSTYFGEEPPDYKTLLRDSAEFLEKHHGRLDPPLGDVLRLKRGDAEYPLTGGPDALRAIGWSDREDGKLIADVGDSFVMFVEWDEAGNVASQTAQPFGAAISRPDSPHYNDQAELFANMELKPVHLDRLCGMDMSGVTPILERNQAPRR